MITHAADDSPRPDGGSLLYPVLLFVFSFAIGIALIWDVGGVASRMSAQLVARKPVYAALHRRAPWLNQAFGIWCILFGIGELVYFYGLAHDMWS